MSEPNELGRRFWVALAVCTLLLFVSVKVWGSEWDNLCGDVWCEGPYNYRFTPIAHGFVCVEKFLDGEVIDSTVCPGTRPAFDRCMDMFDDEGR